MARQKYMLDNDESLEEVIATLQQKLQTTGFTIVEQSWQNPLVNYWSVTLCDRDCVTLSSKGYGNSKNVALAYALSSFVERLATHDYWVACYLGGEVANSKFIHTANEKWFQVETNTSWPDGVLNAELRDFYNPLGELNTNSLIDMNSANSERGMCCIPFQQLNTDDVLYFPVNIIHNIYHNNGISTGNTADEARVNALSEIVERYTQFKIIANGISLPIIPNHVLSRYPLIQDYITEIEKSAYSVLVQDASLGGKYPVVAMTILDSKHQGVIVCFGGHPKFEVALQASLTKLMNRFDPNQTEMLYEASFDRDEIASPQNLEKHFFDSSGVVAWNFLNDQSDFELVEWGAHDLSNSPADEFKQLCDLIHSLSIDIFISDSYEMGVHVSRIIIPGFSEIYPVDDLVLENNNVGMSVRHQILKTNKTSEECEQLIIDLEDLNQEDQCLVSDLIGMKSDPKSIFNDLCVAELITLLALKVQDNERIQEGCEWLLHFQHLNVNRLKTYQCINAILQLDSMTNYATALEKLYARPILNDALALIDGEDVFPLISDWDNHDSLIRAYKKMIRASI